jgi:hypothetical protein
MNAALCVFMSILLILWIWNGGAGALLEYCVLGIVGGFDRGLPLPNVLIGAVGFCDSRMLINGLQLTLSVLTGMTVAYRGKN